MDVNEETTQSDFARIAEVRKRRADQAKIAEAERRQDAEDEAVLRKEQTGIEILSRECGSLQDVIHQKEHDASAARKRIAEWTASADRLDIEIEEHKKELAPKAKELATRRAVLRGVDQGGNQ